MSIFKELSPQDVYYGEYYAYKNWVLQETDPELKIIYTYEATGSYFYPFPEFEQTASNGYFIRTHYNSIKHLYYHVDRRLDFIPINSYSQANTGSVVHREFYAPDHNFGPNTFRTYKNLGIRAVIISIPQQLIGDRIKPGSLHVEDETIGFTLNDDGYGNLYDASESASFSTNPNAYHRGNAFYEHGNIIITSLSGSYQSFGTGSNTVVVSYKSTQKIHEMEAYCMAKEGEFNYSWNPTLRESGSLFSPFLLSMFTASEFSTYPTAVGLYNDDGELLAVGKFVQPIRNDRDLALTFVVRLDW